MALINILWAKTFSLSRAPLSNETHSSQPLVKSTTDVNLSSRDDGMNISSPPSHNHLYHHVL